MRTRDLRVGMHVKVRGYATGAAFDLRNKIGVVVVAGDGIAGPTVTFPGVGRRQVQSRWLEMSSTAPPEPDSPELAEFKLKLARAAQRAARQHGWCDEVNNVLRELGVDPAPAGKVRITLEISEDDWREFVAEGEDLMNNQAEVLRDLLSDRYAEDIDKWIVGAELVENGPNDATT